MTSNIIAILEISDQKPREVQLPAKILKRKDEHQS